MSRYFIDRPIFAWVLAILVMLFGLLAVRSLPIAQFPALAPPQISVTAVFPGADATTLDKTTTQIIEQQLQGIDHLRYFSSQSSSSGQVTVTLTFEQGTNPDTAQVQVNNKVQAALPLLPQEVQRQGVRVEKSSANFALVPGLYSADGSHDQNDLADMMVSKIQEPISRINGVGSFQLFGSQYAMRIWVDPMKLNSYQLTMADVTSAVQAQNAQVSAGQIGNLPAPKTQELNATVSVQSRLQTPERVRRHPPEDLAGRLGRAAARRRPDRARRGELRLQRQLQRPSGDRRRDPPRARRQRAEDDRRGQGEDRRDRQAIPVRREGHLPVGHDAVRQGVAEAGGRDPVRSDGPRLPRHVPVPAELRATLIPTIAIPVVLLGTLAVMAVAGFSINTLTLFGMVLAIGLLVDDAIVVVENVERLIQDEGLSAQGSRRASRWTRFPAR